MPAYNPPPQTLFSPVSNHYQGKAIRAGLAAQEQNAELRGLQIESTKQELANAPEKWAMAKQNAQSQQEAFDLSIAKSKRDGRWESMLRSSKIMIPWVQDIGAMAGADGENSEAAMQKANETLPSVIEQLSGVVDPDELEKLNQFAGEDRVLDANEFMMLGKYLESFMTADKLNMAKPNPKDFTPESWKPYAETGDSTHLRAIPKAPVVSISNSGESAATKAYGTGVGGRASDRDEQAMATFSDDASLTRLELALARGARTGFGEDIILDIRGAFDTLGIAGLPEGAQESEMVRAIGSRLALRMRNPASGLGLTGNTSNKDLSFLKAAVAGIGRSEGGNILLVKSQKKLNQFKRDISAEQAKIIAENNGAVPTGLDSLLMNYANDYEMFTKQERAEIESMMEASIDPADPRDASDAAIRAALGLPPE